MNSSESSLLSSKIISGNPSLKRVWKDVHRVQHLKKLMKAAAHFHLSNNSKQQKKRNNQSEENHQYQTTGYLHTTFNLVQ